MHRSSPQVLLCLTTAYSPRRRYSRRTGLVLQVAIATHWCRCSLLLVKVKLLVHALLRLCQRASVPHDSLGTHLPDTSEVLVFAHDVVLMLATLCMQTQNTVRISLMLNPCHGNANMLQEVLQMVAESTTALCNYKRLSAHSSPSLGYRHSGWICSCIYPGLAL